VRGCESGFAWVAWLLIYNIVRHVKVRVGLDKQNEYGKIERV